MTASALSAITPPHDRYTSPQAVRFNDARHTMSTSLSGRRDRWVFCLGFHLVVSSGGFIWRFHLAVSSGGFIM
jgi:hypothetical protein